MKKDLRNIDLVSINCVNPHESVMAMRHCSKHFDFGKMILVSHITPHDCEGVDLFLLDQKLDWNLYNDMCLKLNMFSDNEYVMVIQDDGHIINPDKWDDKFLDFDYIGAPWVSEPDWIEMQNPNSIEHINRVFPKNRVGNGGFSLRSKKFLQYSSQFDTTGEYGEDCFLCTVKYEKAIEDGIKFAPFDLAVKFSYENPCVEYDGHNWRDQIAFDETKHFGWHGRQFTNSKELLMRKYQ